MFSNKDIARYYDLSEVHYKLFWNLEESKSLHYGYWDAGTKNFHQALLNINKVLSEKAKISDKDLVLDAGCGIGGSSLWLARERSCRVNGISLSEKQVHKAIALSEKEGLAAKAKFFQKDFTDTGFAAKTFDVVWAIESVCHAKDKSDFLKEAYRILKPGGRLILADFFKRENLAGKDAEMIRDWAHGWAVPDFATIEEFEIIAKSAGFKNLVIEDISQAIEPSAKKLYRAYFIGIIGAKLYSLFRRNASTFGKRNVETAYLQYKTLKRGAWRYYVVYGEKQP
ncbi:MAG: methyltransferase domain-containing protein [Cytophagaceae bacterium]|nr:methyltransferase domain-containing protein [Cytophagaceae bacterium]